MSSRLGGQGVGIPSHAGDEDYSLATPFGIKVAGRAGLHDSNAVGTERDGRVDAGVQVLADEEVPVVQGGGEDFYDEMRRWEGWCIDCLEAQRVVYLVPFVNQLSWGRIGRCRIPCREGLQFVL